jgi:hypothetical protein
MKKLSILFFVFIAVSAFGQQTDPWVPAQLLDPAELAARLAYPVAHSPLVVSVGPSGLIQGSAEAGPGRDKENLEKLRTLLTKEDRDREIVIYCGCCPFARCPNIRPAFAVVTEMKFTHVRVLDLSHNIKTDWIDKGYPVKGK